MVVTVISPLFRRSPFHIGSQFVVRNQFSFTFLRYQYTLTISKTLVTRYKNKEKRRINGLKRTTCTLQGYKYNPNIDIMKFQNKKRQKIFNYLPMPRVENVTCINPHELNMQILLNGYKPLPFIPKKDIDLTECTNNDNNGATITTSTTTDSGDNYNNNNSINNICSTTNKTTMLEISLNLNNLLSSISCNNDRNIWMSSATGMEKYDEWNNIPLDIISKLKPYVPPCDLQNKQNQDNLDIHKMDPYGLLQQLCDVIYKTYKQQKK